MDQERTKPPIPRISTLTPLDIHNKEFSRGFRGYNEEEVDEFLDQIVAELEGLLRENEELRGTRRYSQECNCACPKGCRSD